MKKKAFKKSPKKTTKKAVKKTSGKKGAAAAAGKCGQWKAIHDFMPPGPARLRVTGVCTFPTPGYKVTMKRHVPQGINPAILLLDKAVKRPTGIQPQIVTKVAVKFEAKTNTRYTSVDILPDGVQIKVQNVH